MPVASAIVTNCRLRLGDVAGDYLTMDRALTWLDQAQNAFVEILYPLRRTKSFVVVANQESFALPDELIILEVVVVTQALRHKVEYRSPVEFERLKTTGRMTYPPQYWTIRDNRLYIWPLYPIASKTSTVNDTQGTASTTFTLASTGNFRDYGRAIVGTQEEIEYTGKTDTSLTGVMRGVGGTVASSHASGTTITQTDFEIQYPRKASALGSQSTPDIPSYTHQKLENYVLYLSEMSQGNVTKAQEYYQLWKQDLLDCEYSVKRQQVQRPLRIVDADHSGLRWTVGDF